MTSVRPPRPDPLPPELSPAVRDQFEQAELVQAGFRPDQPYDSTQFTDSLDTVRLAVWESLPLQRAARVAAAEIGTQADQALAAAAVGEDPYARWEAAHVGLTRAADAETLFAIRAQMLGQSEAWVDQWLNRNPGSHRLLEAVNEVTPWLREQAASHDRVSAVLYNRSLEIREELVRLDGAGSVQGDHTALEACLRRRWESADPGPADPAPDWSDLDPTAVADLPWEAAGFDWVAPVAYLALVGAIKVVVWCAA